MNYIYGGKKRKSKKLKKKQLKKIQTNKKKSNINNQTPKKNKKKDPWEFVWYIIKSIPWWIIKFVDWVYTCITAIIIYLLT